MCAGSSWGGTLCKVQWLRNVLAVKLRCLGKTQGWIDISGSDTILLALLVQMRELDQ